MHTTLVSTQALAAHLDDPDWVIVDCRFDLKEPARGRALYLEGHIAGALFADLNEDLSAPHVPGRTGRHPLPQPDHAAATFAALGIGAGVQVVAYDDAGGSFAGRLWWMLRWLGHDAVALLDGDLRAWVREGRPLRSGPESRPPRTFVPTLRPHLAADADDIVARLHDPTLRLLDVRTVERYLGQTEPIDPLAGHIPGAVSAPNSGSLEADGTWKSPDALRARFDALLDGAAPEQTVVYCGSGVSAVHALIAMERAGLSGARLYPGSWSDWITDPARPVATGEEAPRP